MQVRLREFFRVPADAPPAERARALLEDVDAFELRLREQLRLREEYYAKHGREWAAVERIRDQLDELEAAVKPIWSLAKPALVNGEKDERVLCVTPDCRRELRDSREAFAQSGLCSECWAAGRGVRRDEERAPARVGGIAEAVSMILNRTGGM